MIAARQLYRMAPTKQWVEEKQNDRSPRLEKKQNDPRTWKQYGLATATWKEGET